MNTLALPGQAAADLASERPPSRASSCSPGLLDVLAPDTRPSVCVAVSSNHRSPGVSCATMEALEEASEDVVFNYPDWQVSTS